MGCQKKNKAADSRQHSIQGLWRSKRFADTDAEKKQCHKATPPYRVQPLPPESNSGNQ